MRLSATIFVTAMAIAAPALADDGVKHATNAPRPASAMKTVDISEVVNPTDTLGEAKVEDAKGANIGQVQRVVTGDTGLVGRVEVSLTQPQKVVALTPEQLRYVPFSGKLRTTMTADQVVSLPAAKGQ